MRIRKATYEKVQSLKRLMLKGWTLHQSIKHLHLSQNSYRKCRNLIWGDEKFVEDLQKLYEEPPDDFLCGKPQDERETMWFLLHLHELPKVERLHKEAKERLEKEPILVIEPKTKPKTKQKTQQKLVKEKVRRLAKLLNPIKVKTAEDY
jgi:hypothetical protein